ncbi:phage portal protein [Corynebacterium poyangense]|nr:phage portal protein [Corynebacterium poyangense]
MSVALASPWAPRPNHLIPADSWISADILGLDARPVTRDLAMSVPALARARSLIVTTIARLPIYATKNGERLDEQPRWIDRTDGPVSPYHRMVTTCDDLLFYGWSLWVVKRDTDGYVIAADRVPINYWTVDNDDNRILINDQPIDQREACLIQGPNEGILAFGADTISHARSVLDAVKRAADTPAAQIELHQTNDVPITEERAAAIRDQWIAARKGKNGGVAFTTAGLEVKSHGQPATDLLIDGRNAAAIDIARLCGIPATMVDAVLSGSSLSYSNPSTRLAELVAFGLSPFMAAIAGRLGMDDIVSRGVRIEFDTAETLAPTGTFNVPDDQTPQPTPEETNGY